MADSSAPWGKVQGSLGHGLKVAKCLQTDKVAVNGTLRAGYGRISCQQQLVAFQTANLNGPVSLHSLQVLVLKWILDGLVRLSCRKWSHTTSTPWGIRVGLLISCDWLSLWDLWERLTGRKGCLLLSFSRPVVWEAEVLLLLKAWRDADERFSGLKCISGFWSLFKFSIVAGGGSLIEAFGAFMGSWADLRLEPSKGGNSSKSKLEWPGTSRFLWFVLSWISRAPLGYICWICGTVFPCDVTSSSCFLPSIGELNGSWTLQWTCLSWTIAACLRGRREFCTGIKSFAKGSSQRTEFLKVDERVGRDPPIFLLTEHGMLTAGSSMTVGSSVTESIMLTADSLVTESTLVAIGSSVTESTPSDSFLSASVLVLEIVCWSDKQLQVTTIKITEPKENTFSHILDLTDSTGPGGGIGNCATSFGPLTRVRLYLFCCFLKVLTKVYSGTPRWKPFCSKVTFTRHRTNFSPETFTWDPLIFSPCSHGNFEA